ncbi:catalase [Pseudomonas sp. StFLB209]|uniref:hypothetical protein n=1 Tax=Pseudomonas sp. StFLB209 TaxID=1028989 RepID=UPI0004F5EFF8|nr:hypothetical protein [Pseudomonas sp. StFLB209]BAP45937.1 catalase [Pseudomonas sp. StFLB209]
MATPGPTRSANTIRFFELLLGQFRGVEGELPSAILYLLNATGEPEPDRKAILSRIANDKVENAGVLAAMLVHIAKGRKGRFSRNPPFDELNALLTRQPIKTNSGRLARAYTDKVRAIEADQHYQEPYCEAPVAYLRQYVGLEDRQIAMYTQLLALTSTRSFTDALVLAQRRQLEHRDTLAGLLQKALDAQGVP